MKTIDLHCHTTKSDGSLSPRELVRLAKSSGLSAISITDHDTISGIAEAKDEAKKLSCIDVIPGIELSSYYDGDVHILGYDIDYKSQALEDELIEVRKIRQRRNAKVISKFNKLGIDIKMEDLLGLAQGMVIARPHFASVLVSKGIVSSFAEAFDKYLNSNNGLCFVDKERVHPKEAIRLISKNNGIAVLAHPIYLHKKIKKHMKDFLIELMSYGLKGIEVYHSSHAAKDINVFSGLADELDLCITGGSDFHGVLKPDVKLGIGRGGLSVSYDYLTALLRSKSKSN